MDSFCFSHMEDELHSTFANSRADNGKSNSYVENDYLFQQIDAYCEQNDSDKNSTSPLVIASESGAGKSALLANWMARRKSNAPPSRSFDYDEYVFWHAIGCSRLSIKVSHLLRRLVNSLTKHFELKEVTDLADDKLPWVLPRLLERAAKKGRVIIVIDGGLHHISTSDEDPGFKWLPVHLPRNVRMILSATQPVDLGSHDQISDDATRLIKVQHTWEEIKRRRWAVVYMETLNSHQAMTLVNSFQTTSSKSVVDVKTISLHEHPLTGNPFFLTYILRGLDHAACLGCDVQQCLVAWTSQEVKNSSDLIEQLLLTFESGTPTQHAEAERSNNGLGALIGHALMLLFVARHGLHEKELFDLLVSVQEQSHWENQTQGTVVPVMLKLVKLLMHKKERLIDVFRSFDTDGNGTLDHDEFYKGMQRLDINVTNEEIKLLINELDNDGNGEIDYRETLDHFEYLSRSYAHGKRKNSLFYHEGTDDGALESNPKGSLATDKRKILINTLKALGVVSLDIGTRQIFSLTLENTSLRDIVSKRYIKSKKGEAKARKFLIDYFTTHQPSLRRCEELPWHFKKCRCWSAMKKTLVDLRTLDIMFNHYFLKAELFEYLRRLTEGKNLHLNNTDANAQGPYEGKSNATRNNSGKHPTQVKTVKFDIVYEYNRAMERWYQKERPTASQLSMMCDFISGVMAWFSESIFNSTKVPPFLREKIDNAHLKKIGLDRLIGEGKDPLFVGKIDGGPRTSISPSGSGKLIRIEHNQLQSESYYFLNRWIWIQFPWLALQTASQIYDRDAVEDSSRSSVGLHPPISSPDPGNDRRFWNVKKKDPEDHDSLIRSTQLRDKAMANAGAAAPSATLKYTSSRIDKIKSEESGKKTLSTSRIPFSSRSKKSTRLKNEARAVADDSLCASAHTHTKAKHVDIADSISLSRNRCQSSTAKDANSQHAQDENLSETLSKLSELREIYDSLVVESSGKAKHLKELENTVAARKCGDEEIHKNIVAGEAIIDQLQSRLYSICGLIGKASSVDFIYRDILITLQSCNPANQKRHLELEQQIILSNQQISDLYEQQGIISQEIERVQTMSMKITSSVKSTTRERQRIKPLLEDFRLRAHEEQERQKAEREKSYDVTANCRSSILENAKALEAKRNENLKKQRATILAKLPNEKDAAELVSNHPMERLAKAAGTHDPIAIVEKLKQFELRQEDLLKSQAKSELLMKDRKDMLESIHLQIERLRLSEKDTDSHSMSEIFDRKISATNKQLACFQEKLEALSMVVKQILLAIRSLEVMIQSVDGIHTCNMIKGCGSSNSDGDVGMHISVIKSLCNNILPKKKATVAVDPIETAETDTASNHFGRQQKESAGGNQRSTRKQNTRIYSRDGKESLFAETAKELQDLEDHKLDSGDSSEKTGQEAHEDFEKLSLFVRQSIKTKASENEQRRANVLSNAKQGRYANKGLILESVLHSLNKSP